VSHRSRAINDFEPVLNRRFIGARWGAGSLGGLPRPHSLIQIYIHGRRSNTEICVRKTDFYLYDANLKSDGFTSKQE
jgi:hypothetical protein